MKNPDSHSSIVSEVEKEHATLPISLVGEHQTIPSSESHGKINKKKCQWSRRSFSMRVSWSSVKGRKRGRPSKQSTASLKKQKRHNPPWIGRWLKRMKMRKNGKEDAFYIHKHVPNLICRSKKEVERYEKDGTWPGRKPQKKYP
ncbi:AT hook motif protein [Medicago truncatula]|uniref:AT hook motif protein n=1 Tax=Medicago truncatula TaxID=3880 RepID=G7IXL6_MEDTR|nr:AT hook motif protein [Medicago truncatula]